MKEYVVERLNENRYSCKAQDTMIYEGIGKKAGNQYTLTVTNAYGDTIIAMTYVKNGGFRLFRNNKSNSIEIVQHNHKGSLERKEKIYEWQVNDVCYQFVCTDKGNNVDVLMLDGETLLGYVENGHCVLKNTLYSAELCAVWMLLEERHNQKEQSYLDVTTFTKQLEAGKAQW